MLRVGRAALVPAMLDASVLVERCISTGVTGRGCEEPDGDLNGSFDFDLGGDADRPVKRLIKAANPPEDFGASVREREGLVAFIIGRIWEVAL
jgi:hypothetical protein